MAISGETNPSRSNRPRRRVTLRPISEINVTPLVDVMLVLLVIFMVTAPLLTVGVPIDLPKSASGALDTPKEPITVSVQADGSVFVQGKPQTIEGLVVAISLESDGDTERRIFLRGDRTSKYGAVMKVIGALSQAGYSRIALVSEQEKSE